MHDARRLLIVLATLLALPAPALMAADRSADFLDALRQAKWDDTAVDYLDWAEKSPSSSEALRRQIPYQRAASLTVQGRQSRNRDEQKRLLGRAAEDFQKYAESDPDGPLAADALRRSANLYAEQALAALSDAERLPESAASQRNALQTSARTSFKQAEVVAEHLLNQCKKALAALPKASALDATDEQSQRREDLRTKQVEARFLLGLISFENARTFDRDSGEFKTSLARAADQFGALHEEFRKAVVGASSRFYQGRCFQELGEYQKALGCYKDLTSVPAAEPEFRNWTARAYRRTAECLLAQGNVDEAIRSSKRWLGSSRPAERQQPEWLEVAFRLAEAYQRQIGDAPEGAKAKAAQSEARSLLQEVASHPNEFQRQARMALASSGRSKQKTGDLKTFEEAFAAGKESFDLMAAAQSAIKLARDNNPDAVPELQQQVTDNSAAALNALELALELANSQTPVDQLTAARYFLCWLYWERGRIDEAAVLGQFIASRYPQSEYAASSAQVAMAALEKIYIESRTASDAPGAVPSSFAAGQLMSLAKLVARQWPSSSAASSAVNVLIGLALRERRLDEAEDLLSSLPAESRSGAELRLGSALWQQYLQSTASRGAEPSADSTALRDKAAALLASGFAGARAISDQSPAAAAGGLYLAQSLLTKGDAPGAIEVLEDKQLGPLTLVDARHESAAEPRFVQETFKAALRAYLSLTPPDSQRAAEAMSRLEASTGAQDAESRQQLFRVYASLGLQLQKQLQQLTADGKTEQAKQVAEAFRAIMARVADKPDSSDWTISKWIGETNLQIAQGLPPGEAKPYLQQAKTALQAVLAAAKQGGDKAPDAAAVLTANKRLGACLVSLGEYNSGILHYAAALKTNPMMLDVQQAAAAGLQQWGAAAKNQPALDQALNGALPQADGKNLIWGWIRLANVADGARRQAAASAKPENATRVAQYREVFFDARYNVVKTRLIGASFAPPANRREQLESARQNVASMQTLFPDLGGPTWKPKFEALLDQTMRELEK